MAAQPDDDVTTGDETVPEESKPTLAAVPDDAGEQTELALNLPGQSAPRSPFKGVRKVRTEAKLMGSAVRVTGGVVDDPDKIVTLLVRARLEKSVDVPVREGGAGEEGKTTSVIVRQQFRALSIDVAPE